MRANQVEEGKSYKRNRDDDADMKKKEDQEKRDAAKGKKSPIGESQDVKKSYVYHKVKADRNGPADYDLLGTFDSKEEANTFVKEYKAKNPMANDLHSVVVRSTKVADAIAESNERWTRTRDRRSMTQILKDYYGDQLSIHKMPSNTVQYLQNGIKNVGMWDGLTKEGRFMVPSVNEGKSYKRNDDEDADDKKKKDQERRDAKKKEPIEEAAQQMTFGGWKRAVKAKHPGVWFDGDIDIAQAMVGPKPYKQGETKGVGEWDGEKGEVYESAAVSEGKSFKRNKDDDAAAKKKEDKEKRDSAKDKKDKFMENLEVGYYVLNMDEARIAGPFELKIEALTESRKLGGAGVEYLSDHALRCIAEGKSYKRNKDEDSDAKKKDNKDKRDSAKNKKELNESADKVAALKKELADLEAEKIRCKGWDDFPTARHESMARIAELKKLIAAALKEDISPDTTPMSSVVEDASDPFYIISKRDDDLYSVEDKYATRELALSDLDDIQVRKPACTLCKLGVFSMENAKKLIGNNPFTGEGPALYPELFNSAVVAKTSLDDLGDASVDNLSSTLDEAEGDILTLDDDDLTDYFPTEESYDDFLVCASDCGTDIEDILAQANRVFKRYGIGLEAIDVDISTEFFVWTLKEVERKRAIPRGHRKVKESILEAAPGSMNLVEVLGHMDSITNSYVVKMRDLAYLGGNSALTNLVEAAMANVSHAVDELFAAVNVPEAQDPMAEDQELAEGYNGDWAILPATMVLYGKRTVDIKTAASEWESDKSPTSILVCTKEEGGKDRILFISSSGDASTDYKVGNSYSTYHDQTGANKGDYTLKNIVVFQNGEIIKKLNDFGLNAKASLSVFK